MCSPFLYLPSHPRASRPCVSLFHRVQSEMGEELCRERQRGEREEVVVGLTGLFMGIDFNLQ